MSLLCTPLHSFYDFKGSLGEANDSLDVLNSEFTVCKWLLHAFVHFYYNGICVAVIGLFVDPHWVEPFFLSQITFSNITLGTIEMASH